MSAWQLSPLLVPFVAELRARHPGIEIGTIGDPAHQSTTSDHNPDQWGFVCAADAMIGPEFTPAECEYLFDRLTALRDGRMAYAIFNRRIVSSSVEPWTVRTYTGSDPHTGHLHISVKHAADPRPTTSWHIYPPPEVTVTTQFNADDLLAIRQQCALAIYDIAWSMANSIDVGSPVRVDWETVGRPTRDNLRAVLGGPVDGAAIQTQLSAVGADAAVAKAKLLDLEHDPFDGGRTAIQQAVRDSVTAI